MIFVNPVATVLRDGITVGLADRSVLIPRDGSECAIEDRAAPMRDGDDTVCGAVLVFH